MPIVLTGFHELLDNLSDIESRVARRKILASAMRKALEPTLQALKLGAPDDYETTGNRIRDNSRKAVVGQTFQGVTGRVGVTPSGFVGYFHEWGTDDLAARPFLQPAVDETQSEFMEILSVNLWSGIIGQLVEEELDAE